MVGFWVGSELEVDQFRRCGFAVAGVGLGFVLFEENLVESGLLLAVAFDLFVFGLDLFLKTRFDSFQGVVV